jgi:hypothetical protein
VQHCICITSQRLIPVGHTIYVYTSRIPNMMKAEVFSLSLDMVSAELPGASQSNKRSKPCYGNMNRWMQTMANLYISAKQTPIGLEISARYSMFGRLCAFCKRYAHLLISYILSFDIELHWLPRCVCGCVCVVVCVWLCVCVCVAYDLESGLVVSVIHMFLYGACHKSLKESFPVSYGRSFLYDGRDFLIWCTRGTRLYVPLRCAMGQG